MEGVTRTDVGRVQKCRRKEHYRAIRQSPITEMNINKFNNLTHLRIDPCPLH